MENIKKNKPRLAFTIDFEEEFHCENISSTMPRINSLDTILPKLLHKLSGTKGTLFVVAEIAKRYEEPISVLLQQGWELGSHTYSHRLLTSLDIKDCDQELRHSKALLEDLFSVEVDLFRAPCFATSKEIHDLVIQAGYKIDASFIGRSFMHSQAKNINNLSIDRQRKYISNSLLFPPGGGYLRILPYRLFNYNIKYTNDKIKSVYVHPWEFQDQLLGMQYAKSRIAKIKHTINHSSMFMKLENLVKDFELTTVTKAYETNDAA